MVFWILAAILVFGVVWWIYHIWITDMLETIVGRFFVTLFALAVGVVGGGLLISAISGGIGVAVTEYEMGDTTKKDLAAIATKDVTEGRFTGGIFASYGYIDGKRVLSYISKDGSGGLRIGYVDASDTVLYEGDEKPRMETHNWFKKNEWFWPFGDIQTTKTYTFYVPTGSVVEGYEIAP